MEKVNPEAKRVPTLLAAARLEKLNLEIQHLQNKGGWEKRLTSYTPLLSVIIAVGGFLFGIYQFQRQQQIQQNQLIKEQQKERLAKDAEQALRIQAQIRSDVDQILQFSSDKKQTISKVSFLIEDLKSYLEVNSHELQTPPSPNNMRPVSVVLVSSVVHDCNFDEQRNIDYAFTLAEQWEDYGRYLGEESTDSLEFILGKYINAVREIYSSDPSMIRRVEYRESFFWFPVGGAITAQQLRFKAILMGFSKHQEFLKDENVRKRLLMRLQGAMCNGRLTEQYFGVKYGAKDDAEKQLVGCPK